MEISVTMKNITQLTLINNVLWGLIYKTVQLTSDFHVQLIVTCAESFTAITTDGCIIHQGVFEDFFFLPL